MSFGRLMGGGSGQALELVGITAGAGWTIVAAPLSAVAGAGSRGRASVFASVASGAPLTVGEDAPRG